MDSLKDREHRFATQPAGVDDLQFECLSAKWTDELQAKFSGMQELVCYLLRKNQQLRTELSVASSHRSPLYPD